MQSSFRFGLFAAAAGLIAVPFPAIGQEASEHKSTSTAVYMTPRLKSEFLGAATIHLRFEGSSSCCVGKAQLARFMRDSENSSGPEQYIEQIHEVTVESTALDRDSSEGDPESRTQSYKINGLPSGLVKPGELLRLVTPPGAKAESASLVLSGVGGKTLRQVRLVRIIATKPSTVEATSPTKQR